MKPLRVLIDTRMLIGRFSGVSRMVTQLVDGLVRIPDIRVVAMCGNEPYEPWQHRRDFDVLQTDFSKCDRSPARRMLWEAVRLPGWIRLSGAQVFHATWNTGIPFRCPVPAVLTVHDVIPWHQAGQSASAFVKNFCYRYSLRSSLRRAHRVITVSGFTADQLTRVTGTDPEATRVIYNGVETVAQADLSEPSASASQPYLLYVGGHEPRKNLETVFAAMPHVWSQLDSSMELHVTGTAAQLSDAARLEYQRIGPDSRIVFLGTPDDSQLTREYSGASALLMLSRAEGFGLPVIEAMSHGCPVIAGRSGALPEIVGSAGVLIELLQDNGIASSAAAVADAVSGLIRNPTLRSEIVARGRQRAGWFTWQRAAEAYVREYQLAASTNRASSVAPAAVRTITIAQS